MTKETEELDWRLGCLSTLALLPISTMWSSWVVTRLWLWFVVPQFHMAPIPLPVVIGLHAMFSLYVRTSSKKPEWIDLWLHSLLTPALALGIGYIAHLFQ